MPYALLPSADSDSPVLGIGLMSGTSADGVDAALVQLWDEAGEIRARLLDHRATRDRQIIDLIDRGYTTDRQIRRALYPEIQKGLRRAAGGQIRAHLAKMVGQGIAKVTTEDDGKIWRVALTK